MASSSKKPKEENKKEKSNRTPPKETKKPIKKPEKKASTPKNSNKSKPNPDESKKKTSNGTLGIPDPSSSTESNENKTQKNVKPNNKRKRKEKLEENGGGEATVCRFPMKRIKRIIKSEDSRMAISQDVVFLVNKATEMFLEKFSEDGYKCSVKDRKKSLSYKHLATVAHERKRYDFLSDYVPQKIKAEDALKEMNSTETGEG